MQQSQTKKTIISVSKYRETDYRNFIKACNQVCYFETPDLELYFSIVEKGFIFKQYAIVALKVKKGLNLYELAIAYSLESDGILLPLKNLPTFSQIRRFNENQQFSYCNKQINVRFEDGESWKFIFKNKDVVLNWMELLELTKRQPPFTFQRSLLVKELKRNYEYVTWRHTNPIANSNIFGSLLRLSRNFKEQMENTKRSIGVNSNELIGRLICEKRDKLQMKGKIEQFQRQELIYKQTIYDITDDAISTYPEA